MKFVNGAITRPSNETSTMQAVKQGTAGYFHTSQA
jgi:hypothetical protein